MTLCEVFAREKHPPVDLRAIVEQRRLALGLTRAALARRMAPRWGLMPDRAAEKLSRFFNRAHGKSMSIEALEALLDELGLDVVPRKIM